MAPPDSVASERIHLLNRSEHRVFITVVLGDREHDTSVLLSVFFLEAHGLGWVEAELFGLVVV